MSALSTPDPGPHIEPKNRGGGMSLWPMPWHRRPDGLGVDYLTFEIFPDQSGCQVSRFHWMLACVTWPRPCSPCPVRTRSSIRCLALMFRKRHKPTQTLCGHCHQYISMISMPIGQRHFGPMSLTAGCAFHISSSPLHRLNTLYELWRGDDFVGVFLLNLPAPPAPHLIPCLHMQKIC